MRIVKIGAINKLEGMDKRGIVPKTKNVMGRVKMIANNVDAVQRTIYLKGLFLILR